MLSIRFDDKNEWWVSGGIFERLFQTALRDRIMPPYLENWLYAAQASGGLSLSRRDPADVAKLVTALRTVAERDVKRFKDADPTTADGSYRVGLERFLRMELTPR